MRSSKKYRILLTFLILLPITACKNDKERINPLLQKDKKEVLLFIWENKTAEIEACSYHWADPRNASPKELALCENIALKLSNEMNYQGFAQNIIAADLDIPMYWREINKRVESDKNYAEQNKPTPHKRNIFKAQPNTKW